MTPIDYLKAILIVAAAYLTVAAIIWCVASASYRELASPLRCLCWPWPLWLTVNETFRDLTKPKA